MTRKVCGVVRGMLIVAMAGEKKQAKKRLERPETPKRVRRPEMHVIGSSSTWKEEQLDRFKVDVGVKEVKEMIPEKWFEFSPIPRYQERIVENILL